MDGYRYLIEDNPVRQKKWAYLTEGIEKHVRENGRDRRISLELMCENIQRMGPELTKKALGEQSETGDIASYTAKLFAVMRRALPFLILPELIGLQTIPYPNGKAFWKDVYFDSGTPSGDRVDTNFDATFPTRSTETSSLPKIKTKINSVDITCAEQVVQDGWTVPAMQDLAAYHPELDMDTLAVQDMADMLIRATDVYGIYTLVQGVSAGNVTWNSHPPSSAYGTYLDPKIYAATLYDAMVDGNNLIYKKVYQNATWAVTDADTCTRLEKLEGFKLDPQVEAGVQFIGIHLFGTLKNRWKIYKHPWGSQSGLSNVILMGYRGADPFYVGAVHCVFIPFYLTPLFTDPDTLEQKRGALKRSVTKVLDGNYFATVTIDTVNS